MEGFKKQMNFSQEELEQWVRAAKQEEDDNLALEKYTRADEAKIKELTLAIEKLTKHVNEKKLELDDEVRKKNERTILFTQSC